MIKKIIMTIAISIATIWAADYEKEQRMTVPVKMETRVGETAINNVLMTYFGGIHKILVKDKGSIELSIKNMGIDIQENKDVVFGYDMTIAYTYMSEKPEIHLNGEFPLKGAISSKNVKETVENAEDKIRNAIVILLDLNKAVGAILDKHGISEAPVMSAIKDFFAKKEFLVDGKLELWRQNYGTLLNAYANKTETALDIKILSVKSNLTLDEDCVIIGFEMNVQSEKQFFQLDGWVDNPEKLHIISNKDFQLVEIKYTIMPDYSLFVFEESCDDVPLVFLKDVDVYEVCSSGAWKIKDSIRGRNFVIKIKLRTLYGGIILLEKELR